MVKEKFFFDTEMQIFEKNIFFIVGALTVHPFY